MRISDWSSDVCSSDLRARQHEGFAVIEIIASQFVGEIAVTAEVAPADTEEQIVFDQRSADAAFSIEMARLAARQFEHTLEFIRWLLGYEVDRAGERIASKERALRPLGVFDACNRISQEGIHDRPRRLINAVDEKSDIRLADRRRLPATNWGDRKSTRLNSSH